MSAPRDLPMLAADTISQAYPQLVGRLAASDLLCHKRDYSIKELHPFLVEIADPTERVLDVAGRRVNPGFLVAEAVWILSGSADPWIFDYNRRLLDYTGYEVLGAYGPRLRNWRGHDQIRAAAQRLRDHPSSQRVTLVIFDPAVDHSWHRTVPCTNLFRFTARGGRLDMITVMRAQDVWLGLPYDYFTFSLLHELMAGFAHLSVGRYYHFMDVLRLYEADWAAAQAMADLAQPAAADPLAGQSPREAPDSAALSLAEFDRVIAELAEFARDPLERPMPSRLTPFWRDIALTLRAYQAFRAARYELAVADVWQIRGGLRPALLRWFDARIRREPALAALTQAVPA